MSEVSTIRQRFEKGEPYYGMGDYVPKQELDSRVGDVIAASLAVHSALYDAVEDGSAVVFGDEHSGEEDKFVSLPNKYNEPCYFRWDPQHPATDVGLRGLNPEFKNSANPTTIIHADNHVLKDFIEMGAPPVLLDALDSVAKLNKYILSQIVRPMLTKIAREYGKRPEQYLPIYIPTDGRIRTLTRSILYHLNVEDGVSPVGTDGKTLLIKEHADQSAFTVDTAQSGPGLQYFVNGHWEDASQEIACMRGTADDNIHELMRPTLHRVVDAPQETPLATELKKHGIKRIALPTFVSANGGGTRIVQPSSKETHPDIQKVFCNAA